MYDGYSPHLCREQVRVPCHPKGEHHFPNTYSDENTKQPNEETTDEYSMELSPSLELYSIELSPSLELSFTNAELVATLAE